MSAHYYFNLSRISEIFSSELQLPEQPKVALVLEGGGQRASFSAGVTDAFLQHELTRFNHIIGVSAGAQVGLCFNGGVKGLAKRIMMDITTDSRFYRMMNWFESKPILDLDWYFDFIEESLNYRLPRASTYATPMLIVCSGRESFDARYLAPEDHLVFDALKASSAIPFFFEPGVEVNNELLVDGGLAHPIPTSKAVDLGCNLVINLRLSPENTNPKPIFSKHIHKFVGRANRNATLGKMMEAHEQNYARDNRYIKHPPKGITVIEIGPNSELMSSTLGSSRQSMENDYKLGFDTGVLFANSWAKVGTQLHESIAASNSRTLHLANNYKIAEMRRSP